MAALASSLWMTHRYGASRTSRPSHLFALDEENPESKAMYDYLRLRDPVTGEIPRGISGRELSYARSLTETHPAMKELSTIHTNGWQSVGPDNAGGRTNAIGIDISNEANVLIATAQGGVWRSTDSGDTWIRMTSPGELKCMSSLVQDHRTDNTDIWYAGTGELVSTTWRRVSADLDQNWHSPNVGNGIYKSTNDGLTWNILPSTVDATPDDLDSVFDGVWNVVTDNSRTDSDIVYVAGYGAIMRSNDGGNSWIRVLGDPTHLSIATDVAITTAGIIYATLSGQSSDSIVPSTAGVWRSTDGMQWTNISPSSWPTNAGRMRLAIAPSNESIVYVGGLSDWNGFLPSLFQYSDTSHSGTRPGGLWSDRSANVPPPTDLHDAGGLNTYGGYAVALRVYPTDQNIVFFGGTNLFRSTDGFQTANNIAWIGGYYSTWLAGNYDSSQSYPNNHPDNHDVAFLPSNPDVLYDANDGGIYVSHDCLDYHNAGRPIEWTILNTNDVASILYDVALDHATPGDTTVLGGFQDQGSWIRTNGNDWTQYDGGDGCMCAIADNKTAFYMSSENGYVDQWLVSSDSTLDSVNAIRPQFGEAQFVAPWMLDPTNSDQMYFSAGNSLWWNSDLSNNAISNWQQNASAPNDTSLITALGMSSVPAHRLYYGTSDGHVVRMDSANSVTSISNEITGSIFPANAFVSCIAVDPQNADSIVVCFSNYHVISIFASNDGGTTWHNASGNLEQNPDGSGDGPSVRWVSIIDRDGQTLYLCGTSVGLFSTTDITGPNVVWNPEGAATIGYAIVESIDVRQSDGFVAIATQGSGVYTTSVIASPNDVNENSSSSIVGLQIWPNPVSSNAEVSFQLSELGYCTLSLFDITGKTVLHFGRNSSLIGSQHFSFDGSQFPNGTYFVELQTPDAVETRKIIIQH